MKRSFGYTHFILTAVIICVLLISSGCLTSAHEGFAIYLTKEDIPPARMEALSRVDIAEQPVIALNDIITYNALTHEIELTADAFDRISNLEVPVSGKSFVVCVDRQPIYWGAFWTPISSISFEGVTIMKPLSTQDPEVIKVDLGYPSPSFYRGEDPRNNTAVVKSLEKAGKLTTIPATTTPDQLPHSMKGYEMYSWLEDSQWHFTLITGTNRSKTLGEIISDANTVSADGWVQIQVAGIDAIKAVLTRLPQDEFVMWLAGLREESASQSNIKITLPAGEIIDTIREYAGERGLDFTVQTP